MSRHQFELARRRKERRRRRNSIGGLLAKDEARWRAREIIRRMML